MKNVTLRQLRVFAAAARHMNFSRAAEELHLSQPAVSTQIKEFTTYVGLPLFERIGRRTYLTAAGAEMLHCANAIAQQHSTTKSILTSFFMMFLLVEVGITSPLRALSPARWGLET